MYNDTNTVEDDLELKKDIKEIITLPKQQMTFSCMNNKLQKGFLPSIVKLQVAPDSI